MASVDKQNVSFHSSGLELAGHLYVPNDVKGRGSPRLGLDLLKLTESYLSERSAANYQAYRVLLQVSCRLL